MSNKNQVTLTFAGDADKLSKTFDQVGDSSKKFSDRIDDTGRHAGAFTGIIDKVGPAMAGLFAVDAITEGISKVGEFFSKSIEAASNLGESVNAVQKVFGDSSKEIQDWGKANANAFGLSQRAFNELATPLGAMLKNSGLAMKDVSKDTIDLTKRAADMASVFNTTVPDALEAIQAGIRGESDPLERYGVSLSAAKVEAEALAETHKHAAKALTATELATARVNLIMQQTKSTSGDFTQTSDQLANSTRILAARNEDLQAKIGQGLLPVMTLWNQAKLAVVDTIGTKLVPKLEQLQTWLQTNVTPAIRDHLVPAAKDLWHWFQENVVPALQDTAEKARQTKAGFDDVSRSAIELKDNAVKLMSQLGPTKDALKQVGGVSLGTLIAGLYIVSSNIKVINAELSTAISLYNKLGGTKGVGGALALGPLAGLLGHRAGGGPVMAGHPYVVGEKRPEVFVPDQDGTILPSVSMLDQPAPAGRAGGPGGAWVGRLLVAGSGDSTLAEFLHSLVRQGILQFELAG